MISYLKKLKLVNQKNYDPLKTEKDFLFFSKDVTTVKYNYLKSHTFFSGSENISKF